MRINASILLLMILSLHLVFSQTHLLDSLLKNLPLEYKLIVEHPDSFRFQLIYTRIHYMNDGTVSFNDYDFNYSDTIYNYPASMVKFPVSIVAVKKLETINKTEVSLDSKIIMDSLFCQKSLLIDTIGFPKYPHLRKWIKRMLIISDNEAYTHTYDFVGCRTLHAWFNEWKFEKARIPNKFISSCISDTNLYTPTVYILDSSNHIVFIQYQDSVCKFSDSTTKNYSVGHIIRKLKKRRKNTIYKIPKSFVKHNDWSLHYSHQLMKYLVFDEQNKVLNLQKAHHDSIIKYMGKYPRECSDLLVDTLSYYDTWKKFFIYGGKYQRVKEDTLRSINIIGRAYGFLSETAYIIDFRNDIDFILSASIYVNPDNIMDGKYNYELAYELFYHISRLIYEYEKKNNTKTSYQFQYYENLFKTK